MVATPSAAQAAQAAENDKRKKTQQTVEKAKASHLTRQLQMRLQYARLKVENGWQKQNLNEVENLYFHNSQLRGPRPLAPAMTILLTTQLQQPLASSPSPLPINPQPFISFNVDFSNTVQTQQIDNSPTAVVTTENGVSIEDAQVLQAVPASSFQVSSIPQGMSSSSLEVNQDPQGLQTIAPPSTEAPPVPSSVSLQIQDSILSPMPQNPQNTTPADSTPMPIPSTSPSKSTQPASATPSTSNHYQTLKPPRTRNNKHPAGPKGAHQNLTTKDMIDFASTSNLTYDSFWSNHSVSIPSRTGAGSPRPGRTTSTSTPTSITTTPPTTTTTPATTTTAASVHTPGLAMTMFTSALNNNRHSLFTGVDLFTYPTLAFAPPPTTVDQLRSQQ